MLDMDNYTIPPELFYSKSLMESCKRKSFKVFPSIPIIVTNKKAITPKRSAVRSNRRRVNKHSSCPELGRLGNVSRRIVKKKKPVKVLKLKTDNIQPENNNTTEVSKTVDKLNPECLMPSSLPQPCPQKSKASKDEVKKMEELIKKRFYVDENYEPQRLKGKSFKFFKTKNARPDESSEESEDDLVPEIRSYSPSNNRCSESAAFPANSFEEELAPTESPGKVTIEALLENLESDDDETSMSSPIITSTQSNSATIQNVIDDLESIPENNEIVQSTTNRLKTKYLGIGSNQMQIDAGQKNFGITECKDCGFQYNTNVPEDEKIHDKHHSEMMNIPKFRGWASEKSIEISDWSSENGRVIHLEANHKNITSDSVSEILAKMDCDFGVELDNPQQHHIYLAVLNSKLVGLAAVKESVMAMRSNETNKKLRVKLGIQRMYVRPQYRRRGVARGIIKAISILHSKGEIFHPNEDMAFSTPTADGRKFIQNLIHNESYLVY
ncbi:unnamed protein product [Diamesa serratosioi]